MALAKLVPGSAVAASVGLSQSMFLAGALVVGFVFYVAYKGTLAKYVSYLT
jgi:hypothetical protein